MEFASYYKMPAVQTTARELRRAQLLDHPGARTATSSSRPGTRAASSIIDFTDTANPVEIAFFDRGPISTPPNPTGLNLGGLWSTYWYNGFIYGTEIARGFDTFGLVPSDVMSANEIAAAAEVQLEQFNSQLQSQLVAAPSFTVVRADLRPAGPRGHLGWWAGDSGRDPHRSRRGLVRLGPGQGGRGSPERRNERHP